MYYDLTKNEYKKHEKEFNKTYIGKQLSNARLIPGLFGCILWGIAGGIIGYNFVDAIEITLTELSLFFIGGLSLMECVLWHIEYRKELKNYIIEKNKK